MASLLLLLRLFSKAASAASASRSSIHDFVGDGAGAIPLGNYVEATASALGNTIFLRMRRKRGRLLRGCWRPLSMSKKKKKDYDGSN